MNKKVKYICYFAHPYESRGTPEELEIIKEFKSRMVTVYNPFDGEDEMMLAKYGRTNYYPDPPYKLGREIWAKDLRQVAEADMILVYVPDGERLSGGCGIEMFHAYQLHKFIQIISKSRHPAFAYVLTGPNQMYDSIKEWKRNHQLRWNDGKD
jgi:hypothetical protein